jgi:hypothetical protein
MRARCFVSLVVVLLIVAAGLAVTSCGDEAQESGSKVGDIEAFQTAIAADGFTVQEGKLETFDVIAMYNAGLVPSCYGNNAQAPYMCYKLPKAPGQTTNNTVSDSPIKPANAGLWADSRLRPDEAIVFIGKTPPECSYFSYCNYIAVRYFPEEGQARRVFGSLGDSLNNMTVSTDGTPAGEEGDAFEQYTVIICTADKGIDQRVRDSLASAGYSMDIVNTDVIPSGLVKMGLDAEDDTFTFLHRLAFFSDEQAGEEYMGSAQGTVFRLTPAEDTQLEPFEVPELRVRGTGDTYELDLMGALEELRQAIMEKYSNLRATELETNLWLLQGYNAIQTGTDALGDNNDTVYLRSDQFTLADDPQEFIIVYGVNHAALGKYSYNNFSIYGAAIMNGIAGRENVTLAGSAEEYLPDNPAADYLYVCKVARDDGGDPTIVEVPTGPGAYGIPLDESIFLGYRIYLEKETKTGPFWFELLYDRVIKFSQQ